MDNRQFARTQSQVADAAAEKARDALRQAETIIADANAADTDLRAIGEDDPQRVDKARAALHDARRRLEAFRQKEEADSINRSALQGIALAGILAPEGLRQTKFVGAIDTINHALARLSEAAKWQKVEMDRDLNMTYGGRHYSVCSGGEKYRIRAVLQTAMAEIDGSTALIFDWDVAMDVAGYRGLVLLAKAAGKEAVIAAVLTRDQVPNLAEAGLGRTYWLADGKAEAI